jgi:hypothetical protein
MSIPRMDHHRTEFAFGSLVSQGMSPAPQMVVYKCTEPKGCRPTLVAPYGWKPVGWWGRG